MTSITRLDDKQCQALCGGTGMYPIYRPQVCKPSRPSVHVSTKYVSKASTNNIQLNGVNNAALGLGLIGSATAASSQSNGFTAFTLA